MRARKNNSAIVTRVVAGLGIGLGISAAHAASQPAHANATAQPEARPDVKLRLGLLGPSRGGPEADTLATEAANRLGVDAVLVFEPIGQSIAMVCDHAGVYPVGDAAVIRWPTPDEAGDAAAAFSPPALESLRALLSQTAASVVFVAVDHAWWADPVHASAWDEAHAALVADHRVGAVLAVTDGVLRDDGERDGIRYLGLPPSSGVGLRGLDRFSQPAIVLGVADQNGVRFSVVDPAGVVAVGSAPGREVDAALALRDSVTSRGFFAASPEGGPAGSVTLTLTNPTDQPVRYVLGFDGPEGWLFSREEVSGTLAQGASESIEFAAESPRLTQRPTVEVRGQLRLPLEAGGSQAVPVSLTIPVRASVSPEAVGGAGAAAPGGVLRVDSRSGVVVDVAQLAAPLTVECWVYADDEIGGQVLVSAPGLELVWADAAGLSPSPSVVLTGADDEPVKIGVGAIGHADLIERWVHVALCVGPSGASLFVDGEPAGTQPIPEGFTLRGPLVIGGRADEYSRVRGGFSGLIDEFRVSSVVRYDRGFTPSRGFASDEQTALLLHFDRARGPVFVDHSSSRAHGWGVGGVGGVGRARVDASAPDP
ncbi:MAG: hypothetical protein ACI89L_002362 [Phycisphaerales bacterium]|jgi:hypothetical protein